MTNEEAINILNRELGDPDIKIFLDASMALKIAIKALEQESKTGHWIESRCDMYICSECNHVYTDLSGERYGMHYCPNCGCRMVEPQESEE